MGVPWNLIPDISKTTLKPSGDLRLDASPEMVLGIGGLGGMLGSTACDCICRECSIAGVMQDFAARLQRPLSFDFSFHAGN